jgi:hypothetical protein
MPVCPLTDATGPPATLAAEAAAALALPAALLALVLAADAELAAALALPAALVSLVAALLALVLAADADPAAAEALDAIATTDAASPAST